MSTESPKDATSAPIAKASLLERLAKIPQIIPALFVILWSSGFIGAKFGLPYAEPATYLLLRFCLAVGLLVLIALFTKAPWPRSHKTIFHIAFAGLLVQATYLYGVFLAIHRGLPSGVASIVVGMQPILTAAFAGLILSERVSIRQWLGLVLGFAGVGLVVAHKLGESTALNFDSFLPAFFALLGITFGTMWQKKFCPRFDLRTGAAIQYTASLLVLLPIALLTETMHVNWTWQFVFAVGWMALALSIGAISLLFVLIRRGSSVNVAGLFYATPPTTAIMAWLMFGETITGLALVGMCLAVIGVRLAR